MIDAVGHARRRDDLDHAPRARGVPFAVRDELDGCRHRRLHEARVDVAPGQERQRGELAESLACRVGVDRRRARHAGVERQQQVERLGVAHLADDEAVGAHAQRFFDEPPQRHLAGAFEAGLSSLQRHEVGRGDGELERLLHRHDAMLRRARRDERAQQRRLARVRRARDQHRPPGDHRVAQQGGGFRGDRAGGDQPAEVTVRRQELADVDRPVPARDVGDHHVKPAAVGKRGVDERLTQVDATAAGLQHPLHQIPHGGVGEHERHPLGDAGPRHEDAVGSVDPHLLDRRIVEVRLQRSEARDGGQHLPHARGLVVDRRQSRAPGRSRCDGAPRRGRPGPRTPGRGSDPSAPPAASRAPAPPRGSRRERWRRSRQHPRNSSRSQPKVIHRCGRAPSRGRMETPTKGRR